ncbi:hypothetical protein [Mycobacterium sp. 236(2023)]|uniref:hypothetical protein n=1 Tax=Mycobacterium sp. 236(2023) TaxID=3038163 RepID=UPI0024156453|nr:hypothetical protein [Mycobacterium sp. 236(2023)]MDG4668263.1 hypothetical protein [Mycobacterium sp. 236(2023)]
MGLLAVTLGVGAAVLSGTAVAYADTPASAGSDDSATTSATDSPSTKRTSTRPSAIADRGAKDTSAEDDPASAPASSLDGVRRASPASDRDSSRADEVDAADEVAADEVEVAPADIDPEPPSPDDEAVTQYGDIGKWMLDSTGGIADYGGLPYEGRTVLEAVNVVIVDPTSRSALEATWRLNAAMRRAGFPARLIHSTGFRGLIDGELYRQQPRGLLVGYSDNFFLLPNNHGRIFGPDPVETSSGYVWSGSFSTEEFVFYQGLPRHAYLSSQEARTALASGFVASGRATLSGTVPLGNSYNTETTTTGDHDGYAVVITLNNLRAAPAMTTAVGSGNSGSQHCLAGGFAALSPCVTRS